MPSIRIPARCPVAACIAGLTFLLGGAAHAYSNLPDLHNGFDAPVGNPTGYELDFTGDQTALIPAQVADDAWINPWAAMYDTMGTQLNPTTVAYDASANLTRVILSGAALPNPVPTYLIGVIPWYVDGNGNATFHTGTNNGWGSPPLVSRHWLYSDGSSVELDGGLTVNWNGKATKKTKETVFLVTYIRTLDPKTGKFDAGDWKATQYDAANPKTFTITNDTDQPVRIDTVAYIPNVPGSDDPECAKTPACAGNEKILDQLSAEFFPPPGDPQSRFISVKVPRKALPPHASVKLKL